jgi:hypothetical protein
LKHPPSKSALRLATYGSATAATLAVLAFLGAGATIQPGAVMTFTTSGAPTNLSEQTVPPGTPMVVTKVGGDDALVAHPQNDP